MAEARPEIERGLNDLRREVIEARNLVIKTDNLLKNLHAELKMVNKRQEEFQKHQWVSSAVAYVLFVIVCMGGSLFFFFRAQSASSQDRDRLEKGRADLAQEIEKQKAESSKMVLSSREAAEAYKMMTNLPGDERLRGIDALLKLEMSRLTPLERLALQDRAAILRKEIGQAALDRGRVAFRRNEMAGVVSELSRFMAMNPSSEDALEAAFMLGNAYSQLRKPDQAIHQLTRYLSGERKAKNRDYAMLVLALSYEQTGQGAKALATIREALANYPNSEFAAQFKNRLVALKRATGGAPDAETTPSANASQPKPEPH